MQRNRYIIHSSLVVNISVLLSGRTQLGCPEQVSLYGYGSEKTAGVYRWEDCSRLCRQRVGCRYWTWRGKHFRIGLEALLCQTFTEEILFKFHDDPGAISGYRNCGFDTTFRFGSQLQCPSQGLQFKLTDDQRNTIQNISHVESWVGCAKRCRSNRKMRNGEVCKFWTWNEHARKCMVMADASSTNHPAHDDNKFTHIFSGDRTCGSKGVQGNFYSLYYYMMFDYFIYLSDYEDVM